MLIGAVAPRLLLRVRPPGESRVAFCPYRVPTPHEGHPFRPCTTRCARLVRVYSDGGQVHIAAALAACMA
jgi:hypothetical protein